VLQDDDLVQFALITQFGQDNLVQSALITQFGQGVFKPCLSLNSVDPNQRVERGLASFSMPIEVPLGIKHPSQLYCHSRLYLHHPRPPNPNSH